MRAVFNNAAELAEKFIWPAQSSGGRRYISLKFMRFINVRGRVETLPAAADGMRAGESPRCV